MVRGWASRRSYACPGFRADHYFFFYAYHSFYVHEYTYEHAYVCGGPDKWRSITTTLTTSLIALTGTTTYSRIGQSIDRWAVGFPIGRERVRW